MVSTILSDKTGTLTRNVMEFFKCSIGGVSYGAGHTEIERANAARCAVPPWLLPSPKLPSLHCIPDLRHALVAQGTWHLATGGALLGLSPTLVLEGCPQPLHTDYVRAAARNSSLMATSSTPWFACTTSACLWRFGSCCN